MAGFGTSMAIVKGGSLGRHHQDIQHLAQRHSASAFTDESMVAQPQVTGVEIYEVDTIPFRPQERGRGRIGIKKIFKGPKY